MPSHLAAYYLPVTQTVAEDFLTQATIPDLLIERVGLIVMLMAGRPEGVLRANLSRALAGLHDEFLGAPDAIIDACLLEAKQQVQQRAASDIFITLSNQGIRFASEEQMASRAWCGANGRYTEAFQDQCRDTLINYDITVEPQPNESKPWSESEAWDDDESSNIEVGFTELTRRRVTLRGPRDQARAAQAIASASDEHFTLTAYAGTGKTHLLLALAETGGRYTHLAPTAAHRQAFLMRAGQTGSIESLTLYGLATSMAKAFVQKRSTRWVNPPRIGESNWSVAQQAEKASITSIAGETSVVVLLNIYRIIRIWCFSVDDEISIEHVRKAEFGLPLEDAAAYVAWSKKVWEMMSASLPPKQERIFSFSLYHLVKWLDISGVDIPAMGTLLLDEAHDLPAPWYSLLRRYPEGWVTMGDPYQCLSGRAPKAPQAKALTMIQSVRAGEQAIPLFRSIIDSHSERLVDDIIVGSRDHVTRPCTYSTSDTLPQIGLRVYGSVWKMLEDALRIKADSGQFHFLRASENELIEAVRDAILLRRSGDRPKSYQLRQFKSWEALAKYLEGNGHTNIVRLFDRGFNENHLDELTQKQSERYPLTLGLLEHCKNLEFSTVMLSPCCFFKHADVRSKDEGDKRIRAIYVAMTRVRDELWLPADALERLT